MKRHEVVACAVDKIIQIHNSENTQKIYVQVLRDALTHIDYMEN